MTEARKVNLAKESFQRPPINSVKSSEGGGKHQIKHKNKIPKALRYDLENALVGRHQLRSANCVGCCSTPPIASKARCPKPLPHLWSSHNRETSTERPCRKSKQQRKRSARVRQIPASPSPPRPLVPRLCRTYSIPRNHNLTEYLVPSNREVSQKPLQRSRLRYPLRTLRQFRDASTQTDRKVGDCKKEKSQSPLIKKYEVKVDLPDTVNKKTTSLSPNFGKCQATTSFFSSKIKNEEQALFKDDLIDVIKEKHDKRLHILYRNTGQEEYPSVMNLFSPKTNNIILKPKRPCKAPHWR
ncbi:hypothetical protein KGM_215627 [Danaus plexippus plexippus]|uniref:Uncharacterized protein n=1 Tax=Danaus plexippus plexippus TaxID=278856 RepID=A0A212F1X7_DANPL|nr:hypothetical protein KGM_215627 [Danaus plexippus plexippus]